MFSARPDESIPTRETVLRLICMLGRGSSVKDVVKDHHDLRWLVDLRRYEFRYICKLRATLYLQICGLLYDKRHSYS
jgi:hypothetical protein